MVTGCPTIHLPFLSPEEVDDYDRKVEAGVIHPPITVEASYLTGGNFVFNRGKSYLFLSGPKGFHRNVHASRTGHGRDGIFGGSRNQGKPRGSSGIPADDFEFQKSSLGARGSEFNEDEVCVGDSELEEIRKFVLESHHSNVEDCTGKENEIKTAIGVHAKVPLNLKVQDELVRQYIALRKPQLLNDLGSSYDSENLFDQVQRALRPEEVPTQPGTIQIRVELLDVLRFPPVVIATYTQRKSPPSPIKQAKRGAKTKPLLKEDIELIDPSGIPLGILGIAITVQLFGEARTMQGLARTMQGLASTVQGLEHQTPRSCSVREKNSATLDEMWLDVQNLRGKMSMRKVISRMIHTSNSLWGPKILFENPYMVKLSAEPPLQNVTNHEYKKILIGRLTCYLEPNYKHDPGTNESSSASESVSITFRSRRTKKVRRHEHHQSKTRKKESVESRSVSYRGSSIDDSESQSLGNYDERSDGSSTEHKDKIRGHHRKEWPVRNARQPRGWLRSTPVTKRNRNIGGIKLPLVKLNRASFLRNVSSDPELDKQMQKEIEKKLKEREKGDVTHTIMTRRVRSVRNVGYQVGSQSQYRCSSQQTDFLERIDEEIMVGESLQSARTSTKGSEAVEIVKSRPKALEGNFIKSTVPLNDRGYSLSKRRESMEPIINLPVPSSYGSSRTEYQPVLSSYGSSRTEYQKEYTTSQITRDSDFGKTFTISRGYPADNIHNASELDKSSTIGSGLSKVYTKQDRLLSGSVGSINSSESRDRRASFSQIEEQTEDGESSIGYAEDFEEVPVSDSSVSEEIIEEGETTTYEACINPRVLRTNVSKALTQFKKLEKVELASKHSKMLTVRNDPRILKSNPSQALSQLQKLDKVELDSNNSKILQKFERVELDSNNSKMLTGRENPILEQPLQILGSSGTYSMGELLLTQDPLFNASDTYSLGQIIENLGGIDYTRDSPCSSSLSEDIVSSGAQSESDQILTVKASRRSAFNRQSRGEAAANETKTVPVVRDYELDKSIVQYLDRYTSRQNAVIPASESVISGGKQQVEHFNAGTTNERKVKNQSELVSKTEERKARQSVLASVRERRKSKNDALLEVRGSPAYQLEKFPQEALISSSKTFPPANRGNEAQYQTEKLGKQAGTQFHSASIRKTKALGPDESIESRQCRRSDSQDPHNSKTLTGRDDPKGKEAQNEGKFYPKPQNQDKEDEEDTMSAISAKIEALCSSSVLDKLHQHQTARRLSSVSSYVPSDDGSDDDLFGLDEEEFISQMERELGMARDPF